MDPLSPPLEDSIVKLLILPLWNYSIRSMQWNPCVKRNFGSKNDSTSWRRKTCATILQLTNCQSKWVYQRFVWVTNSNSYLENSEKVKLKRFATFGSFLFLLWSINQSGFPHGWHWQGNCAAMAECFLLDLGKNRKKYTHKYKYRVIFFTVPPPP